MHAGADTGPTDGDSRETGRTDVTVGPGPSKWTTEPWGRGTPWGQSGLIVPASDSLCSFFSLPQPFRCGRLDSWWNKVAELVKRGVFRRAEGQPGVVLASPQGGPPARPARAAA